MYLSLYLGLLDHAGQTLAETFDDGEQGEPERMAAEFGGSRSGAVGLLRDLQDLYTLASFVDTTWTVVKQAAQGLRDEELLKLAGSREADTSHQLTWLQTRIGQSAPQDLIVSS
ncbi:hypothetical protein E0H75_21455 [Kribbella capetownensis]|uniref:Uncharacterized protein n=1 Tax=Kribbella capetownensis TaxID=1572659 RepID=A0A4R0JSN3_9ACTN|nr:hypothetical protein [Kribbella capetownensis]TCC49104.1 hypothetical protein E0H75_21455 [Kribbella capetownensis]